MKNIWWVILLLGVCMLGFAAFLGLMYYFDIPLVRTTSAYTPQARMVSEKGGQGNEGGNIPGLNPADITLNLKNKGFVCTEATKVQTGYTWTCNYSASQYYYQVEIFSRSIFEVDRIYATAVRYDNRPDLAAPFFGYVATAPYAGSRPDQAKNWAFTAINGSGSQTTFGGVTYRLSKTGRTIDMVIGSK